MIGYSLISTDLNLICLVFALMVVDCSYSLIAMILYVNNMTSRHGPDPSCTELRLQSSQAQGNRTSTFASSSQDAFCNTTREMADLGKFRMRISISWWLTRWALAQISGSTMGLTLSGSSTKDCLMEHTRGLRCRLNQVSIDTGNKRSRISKTRLSLLSVDGIYGPNQ